MSCGFIYFEPGFSKVDQSVLLRRTLRECETEIKTEGMKLRLFRLPLCEENPSMKTVSRFSAWLKKREIHQLYISDLPAQFVEVKRALAREFSIFNGLSVIDYAIYDILRKYAAQKEIKLADATLVLYTNNPQKTRDMILKLYRHVRRIRIQTENPERFSELSAYFLREYGLYIALENEKRRPNEIHVVLEDGQKPEVCDINLCGGSPAVYFNMKQHFKELSRFGSCRQELVEFLCYLHEESISETAISNFFRAFTPKIIKIKNND